MPAQPDLGAKSCPLFSPFHSAQLHSPPYATALSPLEGGVFSWWLSLDCHSSGLITSVE